MIALPICCLVLLISAYLITIIPFIYHFTKKYEVKTNPIGFFFVSGHLSFFVLGLLLPSSSFIFYYVKNDIATTITCSVLSLAIGPIGIAIIMFKTCFEAISGNEVFIYRPTKMHVIWISDIIEIRKEDTYLREFRFVCKNNYCFGMYPLSSGLNDFLNTLYEKSKIKQH